MDPPSVLGVLRHTLASVLLLSGAVVLEKLREWLLEVTDVSAGPTIISVALLLSELTLLLAFLAELLVGLRQVLEELGRVLHTGQQRDFVRGLGDALAVASRKWATRSVVDALVFGTFASTLIALYVLGVYLLHGLPMWMLGGGILLWVALIGIVFLSVISGNHLESLPVILGISIMAIGLIGMVLLLVVVTVLAFNISGQSDSLAGLVRRIVSGSEAGAI